MVTKEKAELLQKWADVNKMCVGTEVDPRSCIKVIGIIWRTNCDPNFNDPINYYDFAIAIVENKPVFVGDELYHKDDKVKISAKLNEHYLYYYLDGRTYHDDKKSFSWNKPKKTININGKEFVAPLSSGKGHVLYIGTGSASKGYEWQNSQDRDAIEQELIKILECKCD